MSGLFHDNDSTPAWSRAILLLSQREHSSKELKRKLLEKGFEADNVSEVLEQLKQENLLSDARFAEVLVYSWSNKGYGPVKIRHKLWQHDIVDPEAYLQEIDWQECLQRVWIKRFSRKPGRDKKEYARQARFLYQRGFDANSIRQVLQNKPS